MKEYKTINLHQVPMNYFNELLISMQLLLVAVSAYETLYNEFLTNNFVMKFHPGSTESVLCSYL